MSARVLRLVRAGEAHAEKKARAERRPNYFGRVAYDGFMGLSDRDLVVFYPGKVGRERFALMRNINATEEEMLAGFERGALTEYAYRGEMKAMLQEIVAARSVTPIPFVQLNAPEIPKRTSRGRKPKHDRNDAA